MAKTSWIVKAARPAKFSTRNHNRCRLCGRSRGFRRKFGVCRICFRELVSSGRLPGVVRSSG